jgi:hypothetical protein
LPEIGSGGAMVMIWPSSAVRCSKWKRRSSSISRFTAGRRHSERSFDQIVRGVFTVQRFNKATI